MTAAHLHRRPPAPRKDAPAAATYPPGHFTEFIRLHRWPPQFEPQFAATSDAARQRATEARMRIVADGREHFGDLGARNSNRLRGDAAAAKVRVA